MFARVTKVSADPEGLERWRRIVADEIAPSAKNAPGFVRAVWLLDGEALNGLAITLWADRVALDAAESRATANRAKLAEATGGTVETWRGEVVAEV